MRRPRGATLVLLVVGLAVVVSLVHVQEATQAELSQGKIVFDSDRNGKQEIYVMDPDGSNVQRLTHTPGEGKISGYAEWSPNRKKIAFVSNRDGDWEIYLMEADGSHVQRLMQPGHMPRWSPDGKRIAFDSTRDGNFEIYVMDADGSNTRRLTNHERVDARPAWSPDGKKIVFHSNRDGKSTDLKRNEVEVYVMDANGSNVHRLTFNKAVDGHPDW